MEGERRQGNRDGTRLCYNLFTHGTERRRFCREKSKMVVEFPGSALYRLRFSSKCHCMCSSVEDYCSQICKDSALFGGMTVFMIGNHQSWKKGSENRSE